MKRQIISINSTKWYHLESLKKYFKGYEFSRYPEEDASGKRFEFSVFELGWFKQHFVVHPKTKRLRLVSPEALAEIGYKKFH